MVKATLWNVHTDHEITIGPYDYIQLTYDELWTPDRKHCVAVLEKGGYWLVDNMTFTDISIYHDTAK